MYFKEAETQDCALKERDIESEVWGFDLVYHAGESYIISLASRRVG